MAVVVTVWAIVNTRSTAVGVSENAHSSWTGSDGTKRGFQLMRRDMGYIPRKVNK